MNTSIHAYLVHACYDWIVDNDLTPYLLADGLFSGVRVPPEAVREGKVVLNIGPAATFKLDFSPTDIAFSARFSGRSFPVFLPIRAVLALFAKETGAGIYFSGKDIFVKPGLESPLSPPPPVLPMKGHKPQLRRVK